MFEPVCLAFLNNGLTHVWNFLVGGGQVMILIVLCSIISATVIIMKALQLRDSILFPAHIEEEIRKI